MLSSILASRSCIIFKLYVICLKENSQGQATADADNNNNILQLLKSSIDSLYQDVARCIK